MIGVPSPFSSSASASCLASGYDRRWIFGFLEPSAGIDQRPMVPRSFWLSPMSAIHSVLPSGERIRSSVSRGPSPLNATLSTTLHLASRKKIRLWLSCGEPSLMTTNPSSVATMPESSSSR
jgi:hypothetical protein